MPQDEIVLIEQEQFALFNYIQTANPGSIIKQIAETRISQLEQKKSAIPKAKYPFKETETNFFARNYITLV